MSQPSIKKNYIYNTIYEVLLIICPIITAPYISRIFGAEGIGIYSYTNAISSYFIMFASLGVKSYGQREIAQNRDDKYKTSKLFWELELMCTSTTLLCIIAWGLLIFFSSNYSVYYAVLTISLISTAFDVSWFFSGYEQYRLIVIRNSLVKIIGVVLLFLCVKEKNDLILYITIISLTGLIGNISMWTYVFKFVEKVPFKELDIKRHYKQTLVYFIPTIATSIYTLLDKAMIGWITKDDYENGYYEQATKLVNICKTLVFSINTVVSSRISYLFSKNAHIEIKEKIYSTLNFVLMLAIPVSLGLISIAKNFVPLFFGEGYNKSTIIIYIMAPLIIVIGISNCLGSLYFTPSGQRARSNKAIVTGAIVNLCLNIFFIYYLKSIGAAISSVLAEIVITSLYLFMARNYIKIKRIIFMGWKYVLASSIMLALLFFINLKIEKTSICLVSQLIAGVVSYSMVLILLRDAFFFSNLKKISKLLVRRKD